MTETTDEARIRRDAQVQHSLDDLSRRAAEADQKLARLEVLPNVFNDIDNLHRSTRLLTRWVIGLSVGLVAVGLVAAVALVV